jgi:hypothetical protein
MKWGRIWSKSSAENTQRICDNRMSILIICTFRERENFESQKMEREQTLLRPPGSATGTEI